MIVSFDLETSSLQAGFGVLLCAVIKPWKKAPIVLRIDSDPSGVNSDDSRLVSATITALRPYNILIAHNGVDFDRRFLNSRAVKWELDPLNPRGNIVDPVKIARRHLRVGSNSLASLSSFLATKHRKSPVDGDIWVRATLDRDKDAMDSIVKHCIADVLVLEEVAEKLIPFAGRITEWGSA